MSLKFTEHPNNPAIRELRGIGTSPSKIEITTPWKGCWRIVKDGKPQSDWSDEESARAHFKRLGGRPDGAPQGNPQSMLNSRLAGNEILLAVGPLVAGL